MTFEEWKAKVAAELSRMTFTIEGARIDGEQYLKDTGDDCWREMFDDGLTPTEAANEEMIAAYDR